jgi:hypothetical protein
MPWIKVIRESEAEGELKEAYIRMREINNSYPPDPAVPLPADARVDPESVGPPTLSSLDPLAMLYARQYMMHVMRGPSRLTPAQREMIATVTSVAANCEY